MAKSCCFHPVFRWGLRRNWQNFSLMEAKLSLISEAAVCGKQHARRVPEGLLLLGETFRGWLALSVYYKHQFVLSHLSQRFHPGKLQSIRKVSCCYSSLWIAARTNLATNPATHRGNRLGRNLPVVGFSPVRDLAGRYSRIRILMRHHNIRYSVLRGRRRIPRPEWPSGGDPCNIPYANFPEPTFVGNWAKEGV
jgi:hypothetical protein